MRHSRFSCTLTRGARVAAVCFALGCRDQSKAADQSAGADSAPITDSLRGPGARAGAWRGADAHSTWRAVLDGPRVTQIDEVSLATDSTRAMRQFRFDSTGNLVTVREEREQVVYGHAATPDTLHTVIELEWLVDSLTRSAKRVNGAARLLQPYEVDNLRAHAAELIRLARLGRPSAS